MSSTRRNAVKSLAKRRKLERVLTSIAALAVVPGACAALGAFTPDLDKVYGTDVVVAIWGALLLILAALAIRLNPTGESFLELAVENEEQEEQIALLLESEQELSSIVDRLAFETAYALSVRSAILAFARQGVRTSEDLEKVLHDLASPLHLQEEFIFGLGPGEAWSFAIYLYSAEADLLVPIWRRKSQNHRSSAKASDASGAEARAMSAKRLSISEPSSPAMLSILTRSPFHPSRREKSGPTTPPPIARSHPCRSALFSQRICGRTACSLLRVIASDGSEGKIPAFWNRSPAP